MAPAVAGNKRAFQRLLDDVCHRMGYVENGEPHYRGLAQACGLSPMTLLNALERTSLPDWDTLDKLIEGTEVPMIEWLLALDVVSADDLLDAVGKRAPPHILSEGQRLAVQFFSDWPADEVHAYLEWLRGAPWFRAVGTGPG